MIMLKKLSLSWLAICSLLAGPFYAPAGELIPGIDDSMALFDSNSAYNGIDTITPIEGTNGGYITLAAKFSASQQDISNSNSMPVVILECGGTSYGNGLYLCDGNIIFATKGSSGYSGNDYVQTSLNDTNASDNAAAVTLGAVSAGSETIVHASYDVVEGVLNFAINGSYGSVSISGTSGTANLSGNESVTFLGPIPADRGFLGGLTNAVEVSNPLLNAHMANAFSGITGTSVKGQIFNIPAPEQVSPYSIIVNESVGETIVKEGGFTDTISVMLTDSPGQYPVTISFSTNVSGQISPDAFEFVINADNWQTASSLLVSAVDDSLMESRYHSVRYNIEVITNEQSPYYGLQLEPVEVSILENDCGTWGGYTECDFNNDCQVDIHDLFLFASQWLAAND